jgi:hypothetical protein
VVILPLLAGFLWNARFSPLPDILGQGEKQGQGVTHGSEKAHKIDMLTLRLWLELILVDAVCIGLIVYLHRRINARH